jgi:hypothetical protein
MAINAYRRHPGNMTAAVKAPLSYSGNEDRVNGNRGGQHGLYQGFDLHGTADWSWLL